MATRATARFLRLSPQKGRLVADMVRGRNVEQALNQLKFCPKQAADALSKVINSAVASARQNADVDVDRLFVSQVFVDGGPTLRRFISRAMGRATRIRKRTCHMTVVLDTRIN